jgi:hypothetical protein
VTPDPSVLLSSSLWVQDHLFAHNNCNQDLSHSEPSPPSSPGGSAQHSHNGSDDEQSSQHAESPDGDCPDGNAKLHRIHHPLINGMQ